LTREVTKKYSDETSSTRTQTEISESKFKKGLPRQMEVIESERMESDMSVQDFCEEIVKITWTLDSSLTSESTETHANNSAVSKVNFVPEIGCDKLTVTAMSKHGDTETRSDLTQVNREFR